MQDTGGMQERRNAGKERCWKGRRKKEMMNAGKEECQKGRRHKRKNVGNEECRTEKCTSLNWSVLNSSIATENLSDSKTIISFLSVAVKFQLFRIKRIGTFRLQCKNILFQKSIRNIQSNKESTVNNLQFKSTIALGANLRQHSFSHRSSDSTTEKPLF